MSKTRVSVIGGAGYGAAELLRHLFVREDVEVMRISSKDYVGERVGRVHRTLDGFAGDRVLEDLPPEVAVEGSDLVFLGMPHKITASVAMPLLDLDLKIIDLSGDFRLRSMTDYARDYHPDHPCPERLGTFVYGLPELHREAIRTAKHVASPGCFATCIAVGLLPLAREGLLKDLSVRTVAMTGSSGSGVRPSEGTHHPVRSRNLKPYKVLQHQHRSEILQTLGDAGASGVSLDFVPVSAPLGRGILAISQLDLPEGHDDQSLQAIYQKHLGGESLVRLRPPGAVPEVAAVAGSAYLEVGIAVRKDEATGRATLCCMTAIDNLIKGGAGQAIQCFNLMVGAPETLGLAAPGLWP